MARTRKVTTKQCAMTGMNFPVTEFYKNNTTQMACTHMLRKQIISEEELV
jgi:hypothetical protein